MITQEQREAALILAENLLRLGRGRDIVNQRDWQVTWNTVAAKLEGRVPVYPKKLVR